MNPVNWFTNLSPEFAVFLISMIPITELRASIPIGIEVYHLAIWKVWIISVVGDFVPAFIILIGTPLVHDWIVAQPFVGHVVRKKLAHAEKMFSGKHAKYGAVALIMFVGIPLPLTGSWTGSLAAFIFNIPFKRSWWMILVGVCVAATLVTLITLFAGEAIRAIL